MPVSTTAGSGPTRSTSRPATAGTSRPAAVPAATTVPAAVTGRPPTRVTWTSTSGRTSPDPASSTPSATSRATELRREERSARGAVAPSLSTDGDASCLTAAWK